jgi:hypothetical protein
MLMITNQRTDEPPHRLLGLGPGGRAFPHQLKMVRFGHG